MTMDTHKKITSYISLKDITENFFKKEVITDLMSNTLKILFDDAYHILLKKTQNIKKILFLEELISNMRLKQKVSLIIQE
jgi:hypothetical protein